MSSNNTVPKKRVTPLRVDVLIETNHFLYTKQNLLYKSETMKKYQVKVYE